MIKKQNLAARISISRSNLLWVALFICQAAVAQTNTWIEATHIETDGCCAKFEISLWTQEADQAAEITMEAMFFSSLDENICCTTTGIKQNEIGFTNDFFELYRSDQGIKQLVDEEIKNQTIYLREHGDVNIFAMPAIKIYPRPSNDFLYLQVMSDAEIFASYRIHDYGGRILASGERQLLVNNLLTIEVSMLTEGKHYIELWLNGKSILKPFVVSRNAF